MFAMSKSNTYCNSYYPPQTIPYILGEIMKKGKINDILILKHDSGKDDKYD